MRLENLIPHKAVLKQNKILVKHKNRHNRRFLCGCGGKVGVIQ